MMWEEDGGQKTAQPSVLAFYCGVVLSQAWVARAFLPAEPSCRPLTGSLCGAGESNGGPACTANALQAELAPQPIVTTS